MGEKVLFEKYGTFTQEKPFSFAKNSTIGCGGEAKIAFAPKSVAEFTALLAQLDGDGIPYYVLGNLSNVLPSDECTERAVVLTKGLNGVAFIDGGAFVYAGATVGSFLGGCKRNGKSGAEYLVGIPCTIGGAVFMNAGAAERYICENVESVLVYRKGDKRIIPAKECGFSYKKSAFMENGDVIIGCSLRLHSATEEEIVANERYYLDKRKHLPKGRSMGCVFKNPKGGFAGDLIERSGLKGLRIGGAKISEEHANFIINDRNATSKEIYELITVAKNAVKMQYGVTLEEEIRYLT